ncbi:MAG: glycosyltransferase family 4 protein [Flavobacterium sp.]|nr:glycosyltransferase family 4 protein [Flavobacterium sp.]
MKIGFEAKRVFHNKTGLGNYSRDLIDNMSHFFPENQYYLYNPKKSFKSKFEVNNSNVFEKLPKSNFYRKFKNFWRQIGIVNDLVQDQIEIFHGLSGEIPIGLKSRNIRSVVTIHDLIFEKYPELYSFWDRKIHYYKFKKAAMKADVIVAVSEQTKNDIIEILKIQPEKIKVIYQGCHAVFKEKINDLECQFILKKYKIPQNYILNVGTIETRKNVLLAIKAITNIDITLVIVGKKTNYFVEIEEYINSNNLQQKIIFLNGLELKELAILYRCAKLFVYPSIYEGFGIPIIEALYSKTPVITTIGGVFPEAGGHDSIYVHHENVQEMEFQISRLLNNHDLRNEIAEKGFEFVQKFNDDCVAKNYMMVYRELIS